MGVKCPSIVFLHLYQFVTSRWTHVQQNRIKKWGFDTVSKNFMILAFFLREICIFFRLIALWQENAAKPIAMHRQICLVFKKQNSNAFNEVKRKNKICVSFAVAYTFT